jgi:hypothetical protein
MRRLAIRMKVTPEWIALAAAVLAAAGIYAALIHPSLASVAALDDARTRRDAAGNNLLEARRQHQALLSAIGQQKEQLQMLGGSPPSLNEKEVQLARIAAIARDCRVVIDQYQPIGEVDTSEYSAAFVQLTARGAFPQLCEFFRRVESKVDYVDVTHFALTSSSGRDSAASSGCVVSWSCKLSGMPADPVACVAGSAGGMGKRRAGTPAQSLPVAEAVIHD